MSGCPVLGVHTRAVLNVPIYTSQPMMKATLPPQWNGTFQLKSAGGTQDPGQLPVARGVGAGASGRQAPAWFPWTLVDSGLSFGKARKAGTESGLCPQQALPEHQGPCSQAQPGTGPARDTEKFALAPSGTLTGCQCHS